MKQNYKAVLFDFDGVIADTMEDLFSAWKNAFSDFGIEIKKEDYFVLEGLKQVNVAKTLGKNLNPDFYEEISKLKTRYYLENFKLIFYDHIYEIVDNLKKANKKLAIVSASPREKLEKTVPKDFLEKFDAVVCSEDYLNGKPNPEPYLTAMNKLNLNPEECIVIENAPLGIRSAKAAGIYCIALMTTLDEGYLKDADLIINNHKELLSLFSLDNFN